MFSSRYMPCPDCGDAVERSDNDHTCDVDRMVDYQLFGLRHMVGRLEDDVRTYLDSKQGRFDAYLAREQIRAS